MLPVLFIEAGFHCAPFLPKHPSDAGPQCPQCHCFPRSAWHARPCLTIDDHNGHDNMNHAYARHDGHEWPEIAGLWVPECTSIRVSVQGALINATALC
jgi:hypothetical protein